MSTASEKRAETIRSRRAFEEAAARVPERIRQKFARMTKEEIAEKLTTYEPGVPHRWFGRPVEPLTKEEVLAYMNGGPEPEIRYKDVPQTQQAEPETVESHR